MPLNQKGFTFDAQHLCKDAGAVTSSAAAQVGGSNRIIDLGDAARVDARAIVDVSAIDVSSGDEAYTIEVQVSSSATFASDIAVAGIARLGHSSVSFESASTAAPHRREIAFTNEINGTLRRYLRVFHRIAGTTPSINYTAALAREA
jgi:hypothetical protein